MLALGLTACSSSVPSDDLAKQVKEKLTQSVGQAPKSVTCPSDLEAKVGAKVTCDLVTPEGKHLDAKIVATKVDGKERRVQRRGRREGPVARTAWGVNVRRARPTNARPSGTV